MADNQQDDINMAELETATNALYAKAPDNEAELEASQPPVKPSAEPAPTPEPVKEPAKAETPAPPAKAVEAPAPAKQEPTGQPDLAKYFEGTPFKGEDVVKSVQDVVKSYKELEGRFTKDREKFKEFDSLVDKARNTPQLREALRKLEEWHDNPELVKPYLQSQAETPPDPRQYDIYTPEGLQAYDQARTDYILRLMDKRESARFAKFEQERQIEREKAAFKQEFPNADADEIYQWAKERSQKGMPLSDFYKIRDYDNLKTRLTEDVRKDFNKQVEAATQKTPSAPSSVEPEVSDLDILKYSTHYGIDSAEKKYGKRYEEALRRATEQAYATQV